jgi:23S rRNA pseudouridine1911/1915/1917 synthase
MKIYKAGDDSLNVRLDNYLTKKIGTSRAFIQKLIDRELVKVNGRHVKHGQKLRPNDRISVDYNRSNQTGDGDLKIQILYEDDDCIVIDKPAGVLVHSKGAFNSEPTIASWLLPKIKIISGGDRAGIVHRLDRGTSGVMICAKTEAAQKLLQKQFSLRKVKKKYTAIVSGVLKPEKAMIDMPIERNPKMPSRFRVGSKGKTAQTQYELISTNGHSSLVELLPFTGRTHQLRVHLKKLNHPIVGDNFYGGEKAYRLYLHATSLEITLPNGNRKIFVSKLPVIFKNYLKAK